MTLIEKTLKSFDEKFGENGTFYEIYCDGSEVQKELKTFITQALQEQDRESRSEVIRDLKDIFTETTYGIYRSVDIEREIESYAKQHNIDLKQDEK